MDALSHELEAARQNAVPRAVLDRLKAEAQPAPVTLSTIMGRLQASIDQLDGMIKSTGASVSLLIGQVPNPAQGYAEKQIEKDEGILILADRLMNTLGHRIAELQGLEETIARRLV